MKVCQRLLGSPKREDLGIFAVPRASMYFDSRWYDVDREIPNLAGKGAVILFTEKHRVSDQIKQLAEIYGVAIVKTAGHLSEYAKDLISTIVKEDGQVAILTDFDCARINIVEKVIEEIIEVLSEKVVDERVRRLGLFLKDLLNVSLLKEKNFRQLQYKSLTQSNQSKVRQAAAVVSPIIYTQQIIIIMKDTSGTSIFMTISST